MRNPKVLFEVLFFLYLAAGLYGAAWLSVDFDRTKLQLFAFAGLPLAILYYGAQALYFGWERRLPKTYWTFVSTLGLIFALGHILLINHWSARDINIKRDHETNGQLLTFSENRGGLGLMYTKRW